MCEEVFIGEFGVFVVWDIDVGECFGVYGGRFLMFVIYYICFDDFFVLSIIVGGVDFWVDGENILVMVNMIFIYECGKVDW